MNHPIATFPNETYLNGLRDADGTVVDALYNEFRSSIVKAVEKAGGTYADGGAFFRVAIIQTAQVLKNDQYPGETPIFQYLQSLAVAQYSQWLKEKTPDGAAPLAEDETETLDETPMETEEMPESQESSSDADLEEGPDLETDQEEESEEQEELTFDASEAPETEVMLSPEMLPSEAEMLEIRQQIRAKRQFSNLSPNDQRQILSLANSIANTPADGQLLDASAFSKSILHLKNLLQDRSTYWAQPLPNWVVVPITDQHFHKTWLACEALERRLYSSQVPAAGEGKSIRNAFIVLMLLTIGYSAYTWFSRDQSPAQVYDNNFQPPASIVEDMAARYAKDTVPVQRPEICTIKFSEADAHYKKKEWREAARPLADLMEDSTATCQSDALFYLAIVGLQMDKPELSLECISKIEDLDRFGEDLYWYMALACVKIAVNDPAEKDFARRAVERALSNTEIPERRVQAEKMLEELGE